MSSCYILHITVQPFGDSGVEAACGHDVQEGAGVMYSSGDTWLGFCLKVPGIGEMSQIAAVPQAV